MSAYEVLLQQGAKDDAAWRRIRTGLYAEPREVRQDRATARRSGTAGPVVPPARGAMTLDGVEALLAGAAARDAQYGAT